jgi:HSP20 family protein
MTINHAVEITRRNGTSPGRPETEASYTCPATDVFERPDAYLLMVDMPGAQKETIKVMLDNDALVVKAAVGSTDNDDRKLLRAELHAKGYYREFNVGSDIDRNNVEARYEEGVLTVRLLKKEETRPRQISIN